MTDQFSTPVRAALKAVDEDAYTTGGDGTRVPQSSSPHIIATILDLLQVAPGMRVLEIGTGTGYSTALLTELTGKHGRVTSVDIDPSLTIRARRLLAGDGRDNAELITGDGRTGAPGSPDGFDRVVAWATVEELPEAWATQAAPGAFIVAPVSLSDLAKTHAVVRVRCGNAPGGLTAEAVIPGGFVEACDEVLDQWLVPPSGVDALIRDDDDRPWWISTDWLRHGGDDEPGRTLLNQLIFEPHKVAGPLKATENGADFYAFLLATRPDGLTTAALGDPAWRIGATTPTSAAFIAADEGQDTIHTGSPQALRRLFGWADHWRSLGCPGYTDLRADLRPSTNGWAVRATLS